MNILLDGGTENTYTKCIFNKSKMSKSKKEQRERFLPPQIKVPKKVSLKKKNNENKVQEEWECGTILTVNAQKNRLEH